MPAAASRWRMLPLAILSALAAAALSGSCTGYADESEGPGAIITAVLLAGGVALTISLAFLLLAPNLRRANLLTAVCVAAYLAVGFGAWFLFIWPLVVALVITVAGGWLAYDITRTATDSRAGYATKIIVTLAIAFSACIVVIVFWANYDLCIGFFGTSCSGPDELNVVPFALTLGGVPPILGAIATWLTDPIDSDQPSISASAMLVGSVVLCAVIGHGLGIFPYWTGWSISYAAHYFATPGATLIVGGIALAVGLLFATVTSDRRGLWFFAIIGAGAYIAGELSTRGDIFTNPWQIITGLAVVAASGAIAGFTAPRKFDSGAGLSVSAGFISLLGALAGAYLVAGGLLLDDYYHGQVPFSSSPLFFGGVPVAVAAVTAYLAGWVSRRSS